MCVNVLALLSLFPVISALQLDLMSRRRAVFAAPGVAAALWPISPYASVSAAQQLSFTTLPSGLRWADIQAGTGEEAVGLHSRVTFHVIGRLVGKQGWVFVNSQAEEDEPYRLIMGTGTMIAGLEEGLKGMRAGGKRRLLIPSPIGYKDRAHEPIPRSFGQRQRLYGTVLNENRLRQETVGLGEGNDVAGAVLLDIQVVTVRPPLA